MEISHNYTTYSDLNIHTNYDTAFMKMNKYTNKNNNIYDIDTHTLEINYSCIILYHSIKEDYIFI